MTDLQANPAAQFPGHVSSRPIQDDFMDFPLEDPFAYPLLPGVSVTESGLTAFAEDTLRLPLYNTEMDIEGQLLDVHVPDLQNVPSVPMFYPNAPPEPPCGP
jgi:hypothetical protein